ncbi:CBL-interacting serine/threonine-protein kinase 23, variant 2 [Balamuthia mandrillaris]
MKQATHPNTVCLFDIVQQKSCINLIMEYVGGGDMGQYLKKKGTLTEEETRHWLQQLAAGLEFMRNKNILHRDLKPDNLLLSSADPTGMLKIADFGLGRFLQPGELAGTHVGTPLYMAPEIFQPKPYSDKADLWSVGVIVYQMLVGRLPYTGSDRRELVTNLATKPLEFSTNLRISPEMKDLLQSLLQRNSDLRISWAEFFLHPCVVPPPPTEEDDFTSSRMGPSHSIMLEEYKKELNEKMAEIQKLKTQLKALEEAKDEEKRKLNEEKEELIKLRHDLEQSIESLKRINETERRRVEELDKAKHQLEKELDEEKTKLVFALQQQQSEKQKEEEDSALLRKEVESLKAQLEELKSKNETAEQQLAKKEQELIKLRQKKQKGKKKQKTKSQPQTAKEKVKATEQINRKQQGVQLSSLDFTLRIPMTNTMSIFHGQRHMTNMEDTKSSKYLCEVFMLEFSTAECIGNFVRVHFDARGDGSMGPLQNPNHSRLIALDAFGREIASTRPHSLVRDDISGSVQPLEFGENLLFSADSPRPFSFDCYPEAAASLMSLASSAEQEQEFSLFLLRSHFIVKTNSRIVGYLDFFAPSSFLSETSYFFCYGKAGYSPVKLFEL